MKALQERKQEWFYLLLILFVPSHTIAAVLELPQHLLSKAQNQETVNIIVGFEIPDYHPEGHLKGNQTAAQHKAIAQAQRTLQVSMGNQQAQKAKPFRSIPFMAMKVDEAALQGLAKNPLVTSIQEDRIHRPSLDASVPRIGADTTATKGYDGSGWAVAVLDTGVDNTHPFLAGKVVAEACYSTTDVNASTTTVCPNGEESMVGAGAGVDCTSTIPGCDHGTHVAGIAAGASGGLSGVASGADIISVQVFTRVDNSTYCGGFSPCLVAYTSDIILGLEHILSLSNSYDIAAANLSMGSGYHPEHCDSIAAAEKAVIDNLLSAGVATTASSGNEYYADAIGDPACISTVISVGATTDADTVADYSNSADILTLLAPGSSIYSSVPGGGYESWDGTSMAAPHVAGALALLRQKESNATVSELVTALQATGEGITDVNGITKPRIQVDAAMASMNEPPVLDLDANDSSLENNGGYATVFWAGGSAVAIADIDATLDDIDNEMLDKVTLTLNGAIDGELGGPSGALEMLNTSLGTSYNNITISGDGTHEIILSGQALLTDYLYVLQDITYINQAALADTTTGSRLVDIVVSDGFDNSPLVMSLIHVSTQPALDLDSDDSSGLPGFDYATNYTEDSSLAIADNDSSLLDEHSNELVQLSLSTGLSLDGYPGILEVPGYAHGEVFAGTAITVEYPSQSSILLIGQDSHANYLSALAAVRYSNTSQNPVNKTDSVNVTARNTLGNDGQPATTHISFTPVNDGPVISSTAPITATEDQLYTYTATVVDPDDANDGTQLFWSLGNAPQGMEVSATGVVTWTPLNGVLNSGDVILSVSDGGEDAALPGSEIVTINVTPVNDMPVITSSPNTFAYIDQAYAYTLTATNEEAGQKLIMSAPSKPDWLSIDPVSGLLSGTPSAADEGDHPVVLRVTDDGVPATFTEQSFTIQVTTVNYAPSFTSIPVTTVNEDSPYQYTVTVSDSNTQDTHTFNATTLPSWMSFNNATGLLSGTPTNAHVGSHQVTITVSDSGVPSLQSKQSFIIEVVNTNDLPTISGSPPTSIIEGGSYSFTPQVTDEDANDSLHFILNNAPSWLSFDVDSGRISGMPQRSDVGEHTGIEMSVVDSANATAKLPTFSITVQGDLDRDGQIDDLDMDMDNDGMDNSYEEEHGLNPADANDASADADGDGISNFDEFVEGTDPLLDTVPPAITPPDTVVLDATGIYTEVDTGTATAHDVLDGELAVQSDSQDYYRPGLHTVTWTAIDAAGNTGSATQEIHILPLASLGPDQVRGEGSTLELPVWLSGTAPVYPVSMGVGKEGSASENEDYTLPLSTIRLTAGQMAVIPLRTVADNMAEQDETVTLTLTNLQGVAAGERMQMTLTLREGNIAPRVSLSATQDGVAVSTVYTNRGEVIVQALVDDDNAGDSHTFQWQSSDNALVDTDKHEDRFSFDPAVLAEGIYSIDLWVTDNGEPTQSTYRKFVFLNRSSAPVLGEGDSDGDGQSDAWEGDGDGDRDGIADYQDNLALSHAIATEPGIAPAYIETYSGLHIQLGGHALMLQAGARIAASQWEAAGIPEDRQAEEKAATHIIISDLGQPGDTVPVVIPLPELVGDGEVLRVLKSSQRWVSFKPADGENGNSVDRVFSTNRHATGCPAISDEAYTPGLQVGHDCLLVWLTDGGPYDADGEVNGQVELLAAVTIIDNPNKGGGSGGSLGWWLTLLMLALGMRYARKYSICTASARLVSYSIDLLASKPAPPPSGLPI